MMIDEIINRIFQHNILELKFSAFSDAFFKRTTRASPFPCVFHQTMIKEQVTIMQLHMQIQNYFLENSFFLFDFTSLNFLGKYIVLMCGLNSFQQLEISMPFSKFMSLLGSMSDPGLMQSMKSASLIFRFLQCDSKSKNIWLSQLIVCFLLLCTCCAIPFVFWLHFTAYWCWYLRVGKNCWVSPR